MIATLCASAGLLIPTRASPPTRVSPRMALVDDFSISRVVKDVSVFDGDYAEDVAALVSDIGKQCIEEKGSFSIAIPGGSVVAACGLVKSDAFDCVLTTTESVSAYARLMPRVELPICFSLQGARLPLQREDP